MWVELLQAQLTDVFRLGLVLALIYTMFRTRAATGMWVPLAAGIAFIAVIIPVTAASPVAAPLWMQVATGVVVNTIFVAVALGVWSVISRSRGT